MPGLVQAVRAGNVAVANALGSGLVETPALLAYLPALCRELLGEELQAAARAPTWWCGEPIGARARPREPAAHGHQADLRLAPVRARSSASELERRAASRSWPDRIRARPGDFVGQEQVALVDGAGAVGDRPRSRATLVVRAFLTAATATATP